MVALGSQAWKVAFLSALVGAAAQHDSSFVNDGLRIQGLRILRKSTNPGVLGFDGIWSTTGQYYEESTGEWATYYSAPDGATNKSVYGVVLKSQPAGWYVYADVETTRENSLKHTIFAQCRSTKCKAATALGDLGNNEDWEILDDTGSYHPNGAKVSVENCPRAPDACNTCQDSVCEKIGEAGCLRKGCCTWYRHRGCFCIGKHSHCAPYKLNATVVDLTV